MNIWLLTSLCFLVAYLLGSLNTAILVCKIFKLPDPRQNESKNPGATNVLRLAGKCPAILTLIGDVLKGALSVYIAYILGSGQAALCLILLGASLGHVFPLFFLLQGGKGVATVWGGLLTLNPWLGIVTLLTWAVTVLLFKISSIGALVTAISLPLWSYFIFDMSNKSIFVLIFLSLLILWTHRANIQRLIKKQEPRLGQKKQ